MSEPEVELVVGKKYKVRLKPVGELLSSGVLIKSDMERAWLKPYLGGAVGVMVFREAEIQQVKWRDGNSVLWNYCLRQLKILGEV